MENLDIELIKSHREIYLPSICFYSKRVSNSYFLPKISRFINKYLYKIGLGSHLNRYDNSFSIYSSFADKKLYSKYNKSDIFINFGSGSFFHNKWKNYDYPGQSKYYKSLQGIEKKDFYAIDLCSKSLVIPEKDNSVSLIYCSHTMEHLDQDSAKRFLFECLRILKPKGILRMILPNTKNSFYNFKVLNSQTKDLDNIKEKYIKYLASLVLTDMSLLSIEELKDLFSLAKDESEDFFLLGKEKYKSSTEFDKNNPDRHISYWDIENLVNFTSNIGFSYCIPSFQGSSVAAPFSNNRVFDNTEPQISFYADIVK
jgi:predicted SAM-dependent methyltransferase